MLLLEGRVLPLFTPACATCLSNYRVALPKQIVLQGATLQQSLSRFAPVAPNPCKGILKILLLSALIGEGLYPSIFPVC
jgi:hypothetical protein